MYESKAMLFAKERSSKFYGSLNKHFILEKSEIYREVAKMAHSPYTAHSVAPFISILYSYGELVAINEPILIHSC